MLTTLLDSGKRGVRYYGIDRLADCISTHQQHYPDHRFHGSRHQPGSRPGCGRFDVIAMLAVIEHLPNPQAALHRVAKLLSGRGRLLITTPCGGTEKLHALGARIGFCGREASEEHVDVFPDLAFFQMALACELRLDHYERFLLGLNQLAVLAAEPLETPGLLDVPQAS